MCIWNLTLNDLNHLLRPSYVISVSNIHVLVTAGQTANRKLTWWSHLIGQLVGALLHVWQLIAHVRIFCHGCWVWGRRSSKRDEKILIRGWAGSRRRQEAISTDFRFFMLKVTVNSKLMEGILIWWEIWTETRGSWKLTAGFCHKWTKWGASGWLLFAEHQTEWGSGGLVHLSLRGERVSLWCPP